MHVPNALGAGICMITAQEEVGGRAHSKMLRDHEEGVPVATYW
jgi:hypothetical protein